MSKANLNIGYGMGLRRPHFADVLNSNSHLPDWFEIISENYMTFGGTPRKVLESLMDRNIPIVAHGVGLSLGSIDELNPDYISYLKELVNWLDVPWFSDHLCFSSSNQHQYHDLLPIMMTKETLEQISDRIKKIQDIFDRPFAFENISYYGISSHNEFQEIDFINELLHRTNSYLLLDINNVYVNSKNHNFDPWEYLSQVEKERIVQFHLAGHYDRGDIIIDTHGGEVCDDVWHLYQRYIKHIGREVATLVEWDHNLPNYAGILQQVDIARNLARKSLGLADG